LVVVFACFLPYVTHHLGAIAPWRVAAAIFLFVPLCTSLYMAWFLRRGLPPGYSRIATCLVVLADIAALALLFTAALGYAGPRVFGFYLSAVLLELFETSLFFARLIATSFRSSEPAL
jgi:hypothetical protein